MPLLLDMIPHIVLSRCPSSFAERKAPQAVNNAKIEVSLSLVSKAPVGDTA